MKICIDMDGVICFTKRKDQTYKDVEPIPGAIETMKRWKEQGHYIIIDSARHMLTCGGNLGRIVALQARTLIEWLDNHGIPYDEIYFGKPFADVYIDDKAVKFTNWQEMKL